MRGDPDVLANRQASEDQQNILKIKKKAVQMFMSWAPQHILLKFLKKWSQTLTQTLSWPSYHTHTLKHSSSALPLPSTTLFLLLKPQTCCPSLSYVILG